MSSISRKTGASLAATTLLAAIALAGCSSDSSSDSTDSTASEGADSRGPITFAMAKTTPTKSFRSSTAGTKPTPMSR